MAEIITPLLELVEGQTHTADAEGAVVITGKHSHSDILRYVVADLGFDEALYILLALNPATGKRAA